MNSLTTDQLKVLLSHQQRGDLIYFIGIGGCGMSGLAHIFLDLGCRVAGSDLVVNHEIVELRHRGAVVRVGHSDDHLAGLEPALVVFTPAIAPDNPELVLSENREWPIARRALVLSALTHFAKPICVAGMHGKTTTSALLAYVLKTLDAAPAYSVGAQIPQLNPHSAWVPGSSLEDSREQPMVLETDESDGTLCEFRPRNAILLNVDADHLDHYQDIDAVLADFEKFSNQTRGALIYCADDRHLDGVTRMNGSRTSYGFSMDADYRCEIQTALPDAPTRFEVWHGEEKLGGFSTRLLGEKNVSNVTAVIALLHRLGYDPDDISHAIASFSGVARRQQELFRDSRFRVFDDYGHHPEEIDAVVSSLKRIATGRLLVAFQPHRYSRTQHLLEDFSRCFSEIDQMWLAEIYAANEPEIPGITSEILAEAIRSRGQGVEVVSDLLNLSAQIRSAMQPGDMVLFLGAGDITQVAHALATQLREETHGQSDNLFNELSGRLSGESLLLKDEPLAKRTTLRVGGKADIFVEPGSEEELSVVLRFCNEHQVPFVLIGRGSNLLIRDGGIRGCVISLAHPFFNRIDIEDNRLVCGAGARLKQISIDARRNGLTGLEFLEGIPGSLGGSMRMNAGAMGSWLFDVIEKIRFMDYRGNISERIASEVHVEYRGCPMFRNHIALGAVLEGVDSPQEVVKSRMDSYSQKRWESQPRQASAGCIFKNPKSIGAGKLIDELGLKGTNVGGAMVSDVHGNFIVNDGSATAHDVLSLIDLIKKRARTVRGIELETEVEILGEVQSRGSEQSL